MQAECALSSTKTEYIALLQSFIDVMPLINLIEEL